MNRFICDFLIYIAINQNQIFSPSAIQCYCHFFTLMGANIFELEDEFDEEEFDENENIVESKQPTLHILS